MSKLANYLIGRHYVVMIVIGRVINTQGAHLSIMKSAVEIFYAAWFKIEKTLSTAFGMDSSFP